MCSLLDAEKNEYMLDAAVGFVSFFGGSGSKENKNEYTHTQKYGCKASILQNAIHIQYGNYSQNLQDQKE